LVYTPEIASLLFVCIHAYNHAELLLEEERVDPLPKDGKWSEMELFND